MIVILHLCNAHETYDFQTKIKYADACENTHIIYVCVCVLCVQLRYS